MTAEARGCPARPWRWAAATLLWPAVAAAATPAPANAFDALIAPMLEARCAECHGERKQKAKLAVHTWEALARGSDAGPVFTAGKPESSPLLARMRLPLQDEEHMPPADRPQPAPEELELLARWIAAGASRSAATADLKLPAALAEFAARLPAKLAALPRAEAEPAWELDAAVVARERAPLARAVEELQQVFPGALGYESRTAATLRFTAAGFGRTFDDAALGRLVPLRDILVELDLAGTGITEASAPILAQFRALRLLRLTFTEVGDATMRALTGAEKLETLAVHGTRVSAASVDAWRRLGGLKRLHLGEGAATEAAVAAGLPVVR